MAVKSAGNVAVTFNSNALDSYIDGVTVTGNITELPATDLDSTGVEFDAGLGEWTVTCNVVNWDSTVDGYLSPDLVSPGTKRTLAVAFTDASANVVTYTWTSLAWVQAGELGGAATDATSQSITFRCNGAPGRAVA